MRTMYLTIVLCLFAVSAFAQAAATWEVRKMPSGRCEVMRIDPKPAAGTRVAGPYKTKQRAEEERKRLRKTPRCKG
jgi:hypothetical protein